MTIVSIRGTHGSGKSTIVTKIMAKYGATPFYGAQRTPKSKPESYLLSLNGSTPLYVIGPYTTACGGADAIQPYSEIWPRVEKAANMVSHVLFEGALVSSSYGSIGHSMQRRIDENGEDCVFAFLDTPLDLCLERIRQRRAAKGNFE